MRALYRYIRYHWLALKLSWQRIINAPLASALTICVIGFALALPTGLYTLLNNAKLVSTDWQMGTQISLFLNKTVKQEQINTLMTSLQQYPGIEAIKYISPEEGLAKFSEHSGFDDVIAQLPENPLPGVIEVYPAEHLNKHAVTALLTQLKRFPEVERAQLDMIWLQRLASIIHFVQRGTYALVLLFSLAVLLIVGNTIRLATQYHRSEIEVIKLVGATDRFIRRPFLYTGILYGLSGGLSAWVFVRLLVSWLQLPTRHIAELYHSHFHLVGLDVNRSLTLLLISALLGLLGSWLTVNRHIKAIEPK